MKFFLCLVLFTIFFAIGECLRCYNCYRDYGPKNEGIDNILEAYKTLLNTTLACDINNGTITGPFCETPFQCVLMKFTSNNEKFDIHYCITDDDYNKYNKTASEENYYYQSAITKVCLSDLCNGASSIFTIRLLRITFVLLLLFS